MELVKFKIQSSKFKIQLLICILAITLLNSCKNHPRTKVVKIETVIPKIENFNLTATKEGKILWKIYGKEAIVDEKNNFVKVYSGRLECYDNNEYISSGNFSSAKIDLRTNDIIFYNKSTIFTVEKEKIVTYDMIYSSKDNKIFSDKEIQIYTDEGIIEGVGFETFDGFKNIKIKKTVITPRE